MLHRQAKRKIQPPSCTCPICYVMFGCLHGIADGVYKYSLQRVKPVIAAITNSLWIPLPKFNWKQTSSFCAISTKDSSTKTTMMPSASKCCEWSSTLHTNCSITIWKPLRRFSF
uniref:Uncharacterized protein n=1 Tax=Opuntia streptacantha TaxID=393608 RepID=A0A7C9ARU4_OPUST